MQNWILIIFLVDNETNPPWTRELKHDCVDEGNVIREKKKTTRRKMFSAERLHSINQAPDSKAEEIQNAFGRGSAHHCFIIYNPRDAHCNRQFDERKYSLMLE